LITPAHNFAGVIFAGQTARRSNKFLACFHLSFTPLLVEMQNASQATP
jgi:hypothetical protein